MKERCFEKHESFFPPVLILFAGVIFVLSLFTGCQNFLTGGDIKRQLEEEIALAKSPAFNVEIALSSSSHGNITPNGNCSTKVGIPIEIEFRMDNLYFFKRFEVIDKSTNRILSDAVEFSEIDSKKYTSYTTIKTSAKILSVNSNLLIRPVCGLLNDTVAPEFHGDIVFAADRESFARGDYLLDYDSYDTYSEYDTAENHINKSIYISLSVKEEDSGIDHLKIVERLKCERSSYNDIDDVFSEYVKTVDFTEKEDRVFYTEFDYTIAMPQDGIIQLDICAVDGGGNESSVRSLFVSKDTTCDFPFYIYNTLDFTHQYSCSLEEIQRYVTENVDVVLHSGKGDRWSIRSDSGITKAYGLVWKYAYASDRTVLENMDMTEIPPSELVEHYESNAHTGYYEYFYECSLSVAVPDKSKMTFVKITVMDLVGNSNSRYFAIPPVPKTVLAYISEEPLSASANAKRMYLTLTNPSDSEIDGFEKSFSYNIYRHSLSCQGDTWDRLGTVYPSSQNYVISESQDGYDTLSETPYYTQLYYSFYDEYGDWRYIYGPVSEENIARMKDDVSLSPLTVSPSMVSITPNEVNSHRISITLDETEVSNFDSIVVCDNERSYSVHEFSGNKISFDVDTENFYEPYNPQTRDEYKFDVIGIKNNASVTTEYEVSASDASIVDNVPPVYIDDVTKNRDYTGKFLDLTMFSDVGAGFPYFQWSDVTYKGVDSSYLATRETILEQSRMMIPLRHLPQGTFLISFEIEDSAGNVTPISFEYTSEWKTFSYYQDYSYSLDVAGSTAYSTFNVKPKSYNSDVFYEKVSYDKIESNSWVHLASNQGMMTQSLVSVPYSYKSGVPTGTKGFLRFYLTNDKTYDGRSFGGPFYLYSGGKQTVGVKDIIEGKRGIQIYSNKPFYVHTVWNEVNFGDDATEWEYHCTVNAEEPRTNAELYPMFVEDDSSSAPYYYALDSSYIPEGCYYAAVVHFADNTALVSSVRQK